MGVKSAVGWWSTFAHRRWNSPVYGVISLCGWVHSPPTHKWQIDSCLLCCDLQRHACLRLDLFFFCWRDCGTVDNFGETIFTWVYRCKAQVQATPLGWQYLLVKWQLPVPVLHVCLALLQPAVLLGMMVSMSAKPNTLQLPSASLLSCRI